MNPIFHQLVSARLKARYARTGAPPREVEQRARVAEVELSHGLTDIGLIIVGAFIAAFGLRSFLLPSHFIDGGVTGISLIVVQLTGWRLSILLVLFNAPFLLMAARTVSPRFALKSLAGILALGAIVYLVPFPVVTTDALLVATFGGLFLGLGIGLAIRGGGILDGTEVIAIFFSRRTGLSIGSIILLINLAIFGTAAALLGVEIALYAVLTYFAAAKTVDYVIDGVESYIGITIISPLSDAIRKSITEVLGRGCTIYNGTSGYKPQGRAAINTEILYTVMTRLELARLRVEIDKLDPNAFVVMTPVMDTRGGMLKKRPLERLEGRS